MFCKDVIDGNIILITNSDESYIYDNVLFIKNNFNIEDDFFHKNNFNIENDFSFKNSFNNENNFFIRRFCDVNDTFLINSYCIFEHDHPELFNSLKFIFDIKPDFLKYIYSYPYYRSILIFNIFIIIHTSKLLDFKENYSLFLFFSKKVLDKSDILYYYNPVNISKNWLEGFILNPTYFFDKDSFNQGYGYPIVSIKLFKDKPMLIYNF